MCIGDQKAAMAHSRGFDPEGAGYDYPRAAQAGMVRGADKHMGSVAPASLSQQQRFGLPDGSYVILKGAAHPTFDLAVQADLQRGAEILKHGPRSYSVPRGAVE